MFTSKRLVVAGTVDGKIRSALISESDSDDTVATKGYVDAANGGGGGGGVLMLSGNEPDCSPPSCTPADAANYCRDLATTCAYMVDESTCPSGTFDDWRLPTTEELMLFMQNPSDTHMTITRTICGISATHYWVRMDLTGLWDCRAYNSNNDVRCVR